MLMLVGVLLPQTALAGPLHDAAENGDLDKVKRLIGEGADVNARDDYSLTPLHFSAGAGHTAVVELLIAEGADVNA
ncbi:MAG: ankyrin repeat domain-containing protein, partial [Acidiferrobacterales bacterium]